MESKMKNMTTTTTLKNKKYQQHTWLKKRLQKLDQSNRHAGWHDYASRKNL